MCLPSPLTLTNMWMYVRFVKSVYKKTKCRKYKLWLHECTCVIGTCNSSGSESFHQSGILWLIHLCVCLYWFYWSDICLPAQPPPSFSLSVSLSQTHTHTQACAHTVLCDFLQWDQYSRSSWDYTTSLEISLVAGSSVAAREWKRRLSFTPSHYPWPWSRPWALQKYHGKYQESCTTTRDGSTLQQPNIEPVYPRRSNKYCTIKCCIHKVLTDVLTQTSLTVCVWVIMSYGVQICEEGNGILQCASGP